jgi:poly-gamma-glutamate synthesis protein (capsule biosynthesis protein)
MNILISGDFYISDVFQNKDLFDQSVIDLFQQADYRMVNLEAPITANEPQNRILKTGPHLRMSEDTVIPYLKQLKVDAVTLANNHILDYGVKGLTDTFKTLKNNHIDYVGAGHNLAEANKPLTLEKDRTRVAILNFCEKEWSIAESHSPGANPMDIIDNINQIKAAKVNYDKVICIIHGGHEYYHLPSPRMVKQYHFYVDNGADAIVGHHTHCIGGYEVYKDAPIIYGLGNFQFTKDSIFDVWYNGLLVNLIVKRNSPVTFDLFPIHQGKNNYKIDLLEKKERMIIFNKIAKFNIIISNPELLNKKWEEFIFLKSKDYLLYISPINSIKNRYLKSIFNRLGIRLLKQEYLLRFLNLIRCESHEDAIFNVVKYYLKSLKNEDCHPQ